MNLYPIQPKYIIFKIKRWNRNTNRKYVQTSFFWYSNFLSCFEIEKWFSIYFFFSILSSLPPSAVSSSLQKYRLVQKLKFMDFLSAGFWYHFSLCVSSKFTSCMMCVHRNFGLDFSFSSKTFIPVVQCCVLAINHPRKRDHMEFSIFHWFEIEEIMRVCNEYHNYLKLSMRLVGWMSSVGFICYASFVFSVF